MDLRRNTGGDVWAPLAGIGNILGEGLAGAFIDARGEIARRWWYRRGVAWLSGVPMAGAGWAACCSRPRVTEGLSCVYEKGGLSRCSSVSPLPSSNGRPGASATGVTSPA